VGRQLVIFDVDGTLVDSQDFIVEAQHYAFAQFGLPPVTRQKALSIVGLSLREAFIELAGPQAPVDGLAQAYRDFWALHRHNPIYDYRMFAGAVETIERLAMRPDIVLGLATGKSRRGVDHLIERHKWQGYFATIQTSDTHPSKPAPSMITAALHETRVPADRSVMIGDTSFDIEMAVAAGVRAIGVSWGYHDSAALHAAGAQHVIDDFAALWPLVEGGRSDG
jgi:phosphoglycolate phosphatase